MEYFKPTREDGRSDRQVIYDVTKDGTPGTLFPYKDLIAALSEGLPDGAKLERVYPAVGMANRTLLREQKRYLSVVRGRGYKILAAEEHLPVAMYKKERAQKTLKLGIEILKNVRMEEMDENQRNQHTGQLMFMAGIYGMVQESAKRHNRQEKAIDELKGRLDAANI